MYDRLQFNILAVIGEYERELIWERSMEGREKAISQCMGRNFEGLV